MLVPPQPAFLSRSGGGGAGGSRFAFKNASMTSLSSSSNDHDPYGSWSQDKRNSFSGSSVSQRGGSMDTDAKAREVFFKSERRGSWKNSAEGSSDADSRQQHGSSDTAPSRRGSSSKSKGRSGGGNHGDSLTVGGGGGSIKGLGRRLFKRNSSTNLTGSRSNSASSASTAPSSPPLTPTTPPVLPVWLPNGRKDFFGDSPSLPPVSLTVTGKPLQSLDVRLGELASKSPLSFAATESSGTAAHSPSSAGLSLAPSPVGRSASLYPDAASSSTVSLTESLRSPSSLLSAASLPTLPEATATRSESRSAGPSGMPALFEEGGDGDSDFLRAVLNFGESEEDDASTCSSRGGRAAPLPRRSSSLFTSAESGGSSSLSTTSLASFRYYGGYSSSASSSIQRRNGKLVMTEAAARELSAGPAYRNKTVRPLHVRPGLFRRDSDDSEDEYGEEDADSKVTSPTSPASPISPRTPGPVAPQERVASAVPTSSATATSPTSSSFKQTLSYFSSLGKAKSKVTPPSSAVGEARKAVSAATAATKPKGPLENVAVTGEPDDEKEYVVLRPAPPGLDTPSKRSLYTCTLLKVHPYLAPTLVPSLADAPGGLKSSQGELRFPRSINCENTLRNHTSTLGVSRSLHAAVGRTIVMRKLKRFSLPIEQEVEISWFQRKYSTESVSPEVIRTALAKRQMVNPEALARPPIMTPNLSSDAKNAAVGPDNGDLAASRRLSGVVKLAPGQKLASSSDPDHNGMIVWARRPGFQDRCTVIHSEDTGMRDDAILPGNNLQIGVGTVLPAKAQAKAQPIAFSPRVRLLAGLPSVEEERRLKTPIPVKYRRRESQHISRLFASEPGYDGSAGARSRQASADGLVMGGSRPTREQRPRETVKKSLPPWMAPRQPLLAPNAVATAPSNGRSPPLSQSGPFGPDSDRTPASSRGQSSNGSAVPIVAEEESDPRKGQASEEAESESEEDVPLGQLRDFRAHRAAEVERIQKLEQELAQLKLKEQIREREDSERRELEERTRRLEEERVAEIRKAREQAMLQERSKKMLTEARERRANTRASALLSTPNYGAGNPLLAASPSRLVKQPSNSNIAAANAGGETTGPGATSDSRSRKLRHSSSLAQMSPLGGEAQLPRLDHGLYAVPEHAGSHASMMMMVPPAPMQPPQPQHLLVQHQAMPSNRTSMMSLAAPPSAYPTAPIASESKRASLAPPSPQPATRSPTMATLSPPRSPSMQQQQYQAMPSAQHPHPPAGMVVPPARRTSMMPVSPTSPNLHAVYTGAGGAAAHSMSMTNLQAQAYLQQQQQQHYHPGVSQTVRVSSRPGARASIMPQAPLVSLYGNAIPHSASQRPNGWM